MTKVSDLFEKINKLRQEERQKFLAAAAACLAEARAIVADTTAANKPK